MKSINKMAAAALLALSSVGVASAQTYHVTGSTAYRVADVSAEVQIVGTSGKAVFYGSSSLTGANYSVVENSAGTVKFENYFNGSIAGDQALVNGVTLNFPSGAANAPVGPLTLATPSSLTPASGGVEAPTTSPTGTPQNNTISFPGENDPATPDLVFSDVAFATAQQIILSVAGASHSAPSNADSFEVGIVPFVFVANGTPDVTDLGTAGPGQVPVLSIDPQKFTYTWENGGSLLSFFTGNNSDEAVTVYPLGRDIDSGTRATALAETGYGLAGSGIITGNVAQWYPYADTTDLNNNLNSGGDPSFTSTTGVIGVDSTLTNPTNFGLAPVPTESIDGVTMGYGDGGYYSGGNLAIGISTAFDSSVTATVEVTYLGVSDAANALNGSKSGTHSKEAYLLAYNGNAFYPSSLPTGVTLASNASAIYEGKYTFWGFEHLYASSATGVATEASTLAGLLNGGIDQLSSNGVTRSGLKVVRASGDGSNIQ